MILFVTFFNFLRRHSTLEFKPPVELEELKGVTLMPDKWITLLNLSKTYINQFYSDIKSYKIIE